MGEESILKEFYPVPERILAKAWVKGRAEYDKLYAESIADPAAWWAKQADEILTFYKKWDKVMDYNFDIRKGPIFAKFFEGAKLNVSYNCLDRHLATKGDKVAIQWEGNEPGEQKAYTYKELHTEVCKFANVLKKHGIKRGDRVCIYTPMVVEAAIAMLACTRIGAIHAIVFGGFSSDALAVRIQDSQAKLLVVCDGTFRGAKAVPQKKDADAALKECPTIEKVIVVQRVGDKIQCDWTPGRDLWWHDEMATVDANCECEQMDAEDTLFVLYTSGSTGQPKGALHTTAGYLLYAAYTSKFAFDLHDEDVHWCTADIGWVTGHSYVVYGPLTLGATSIMFEGVPNYPNYSRFWQVCEKYKVTSFYTAPTAIRAIAKEGDEWLKGIDLSSLRVLSSVGEPLNPEAWQWFYEKIGGSQCPIVDTWWQTETGGHMILPLPGAIDIKPAKPALPIMGVVPALVDDQTGELKKDMEATGALCFETAWPGITRTIYGDHNRYQETYFEPYPGYYFSGDGALRDKDGYYRITGRIDDVINVSGHRMGTAEVEATLNSHPAIAESAVVGYPHEIKGQSIYAYVTLKSGNSPSEELKKELVAYVRTNIGPIATPEKIQWADGLPKTRSGKIMRRILKKVAANELNDLGDTSTLADPAVVDDLIKNRL
ncbi:acetyl-coenzyme A synthetase [Syntrophus gentianae]|uniref:Acetyl-coenzyme A synthetase n=1 Tax=Syntrophus gentianae TaxID=43775 RepID=A0A1H7UE53_9BACT|nr:acetate--CoA ligase [Syntrophus gentianae]SEL95109.1 acetyl-coenzyme A synthetase [Syntrophus gentianae]